VTAERRSWVNADRIAADLLFALGVAVAVSLSGNKCDWMQDPTVGTAPVEDASGNRTLFLLALLVAVSIPELVMLMPTHSRKDRLLSAGLLAVAVVIGWIRY
jgi:hypothetical protein